MDTVQVVIEGVHLFDDPVFFDRFIVAIRNAIDTKDSPPTKIAIDPFKDLGPRRL